MEETIFVLESGANTYYIDFDRNADNNKPYAVFTNEVFRRCCKTFGEALEYIFEKQGTITFYTEKSVKKMIELSKR